VTLHATVLCHRRSPPGSSRSKDGAGTSATTPANVWASGSPDDIVYPAWLFPAHLSRDAMSLLCALLHFDPERRLSVHDALAHPFVTVEDADAEALARMDDGGAGGSPCGDSLSQCDGSEGEAMDAVDGASVVLGGAALATATVSLHGTGSGASASLPAAASAATATGVVAPLPLHACSESTAVPNMELVTSPDPNHRSSRDGFGAAPTSPVEGQWSRRDPNASTPVRAGSASSSTAASVTGSPADGASVTSSSTYGSLRDHVRTLGMGSSGAASSASVHSSPLLGSMVLAPPPPSVFGGGGGSGCGSGGGGGGGSGCGGGGGGASALSVATFSGFLHSLPPAALPSSTRDGSVYVSSRGSSSGKREVVEGPSFDLGLAACAADEPSGASSAADSCSGGVAASVRVDERVVTGTAPAPPASSLPSRVVEVRKGPTFSINSPPLAPADTDLGAIEEFR
jgi:hypothetical protein